MVVHNHVHAKRKKAQLRAGFAGRLRRQVMRSLQSVMALGSIFRERKG